MHNPHYPDIRVSVHSENPLVLVAAVREAMRLARLGRGEIRRFSTEAFASADPWQRRKVCARWVDVANRGALQ